MLQPSLLLGQDLRNLLETLLVNHHSLTPGPVRGTGLLPPPREEYQ